MAQNYKHLFTLTANRSLSPPPRLRPFYPVPFRSVPSSLVPSLFRCVLPCLRSIPFPIPFCLVPVQSLPIPFPSRPDPSLRIPFRPFHSTLVPFRAISRCPVPFHPVLSYIPSYSAPSRPSRPKSSPSAAKAENRDGQVWRDARSSLHPVVQRRQCSPAGP